MKKIINYIFGLHGKNNNMDTLMEGIEESLNQLDVIDESIERLQTKGYNLREDVKENINIVEKEIERFKRLI